MFDYLIVGAGFAGSVVAERMARVFGRRDRAERDTGVHFTGRLATYRYYNMDQVVAQSLALCTCLTSVQRHVLASVL